MGRMPADVEPLLSEFNLNPLCDSVVLSHAEKSLGVSFPPEYREFLLHANGGEGIVGGESYLILDRAEDLVDFHVRAKMPDLFPGFVAIGTDGGGTGFAFDFANSVTRIVAYDPVSSSPEDRWFVGASFWEFLKRLARITCGIDWDNSNERG